MRNRQSAKLLAAAVGGGALVVMGAFTALAGGQSASSPSIMSGPMTVGVTVTQALPAVDAPATTLLTPKAVPAVKAKAYT